MGRGDELLARMPAEMLDLSAEVTKWLDDLFTVTTSQLNRSSETIRQMLACIQEVRKLHKDDGGYCDECDRKWPCATYMATKWKEKP